MGAQNGSAGTGVMARAGAKDEPGNVVSNFFNPGHGPRQGALLTVVKSKGNALTKSFSLSSDGELVKRPGGKLFSGELYRATVRDAAELASLLAKQTPQHALIYGVFDYDKALIATESHIEALQRCDETHENVTVKGDKVYGKDDIPFIARTRSNFNYPDGPSVMMIDYDAPRVEGVERLDTDALLEVLDKASGGFLKQAPFIVAHSTSSFIYNGDTQLKGASGIRVLVLVENGSDIKRAGEVLFDRLILAGHGYAEISKSGNVEVKTLVDRYVWLPERFDFISGAHCEPPLEQRRPAFEVHNSDAAYLDTSGAFPALSYKERKELASIKEDIKKSVADEARKARVAWAEARAKAKCESSGIDLDKDPIAYDKTRRLYLRAVENKVLMGDFELIAQNGEVVSVGTLLDDPIKWNGKKFHDPLEPDYNNDDPRICTAYLFTKGQKHLYSFAHGGRKFILNRHLRTITVKAGERAENVRTALEILKTDGGIYVRGKELVRVGDTGELWPLDLSGLQYELDVFARWVKYSAREKKDVPCDVPENIATGVLAARNEWQFPEIKSVVHAPLYLPKTGHVIEGPGLDDATGVFVAPAGNGGTWPGVPATPTQDDAAEAVRALWHAFEKFPVVGPVDRGVALAAILTAFTRPALDTAPAFGFTAPVAGSGKSLMALSMSYLAGTPSADMMPGKVQDEEIRKRLLAIGRRASVVSIFDNISGAFASDSLCLWLSNEYFQDRVLGVSKDTTVPTRTLMLLTGNNLLIKGDLCRRVLMCHIDPKMESPHKRAFRLNPAEHCRANYLALAASAITLLRYYRDKPCLVHDRTASFEVWSDTIRKTVMWVGKDGFLDVADPIIAVDEAYKNDPETARLRTFLRGWFSAFGDKPTSVSDCIARATHNVTSEDEGEDAAGLPGVVDEIAAQRGKVEPRILAAWLRAHTGRILDGLCVEKHGLIRGATHWRVRRAA